MTHGGTEVKKEGGNNGIFEGFIAKLRDNIRLELAVYAAILAVAAVIFAVTGGISCNGKQRARAEEPAAQNADAAAFRNEEQIEAALEGILSGIAGAGRVKVMIAYGSTSELVTAEELRTSKSASGESSERNPFKLSTGGAYEPLVITELMPRVCGVIVIAEGAGDIRVKNDLQTAVQTLLGVEASKVGVYRMGQG